MFDISYAYIYNRILDFIHIIRQQLMFILKSAGDLQ
jgi:hypothetical protein